MLEWDLDRKERDVVKVKEKRKKKYKKREQRNKKLEITGTEENRRENEDRYRIRREWGEKARIFNREERGSIETGSTDRLGL